MDWDLYFETYFENFEDVYISDEDFEFSQSLINYLDKEDYE